MSIATQKSLDLMRKNDWSPWMVERFIGKGKFGVRRDLYNIIDIIGIDPGTKKFIGIQSTTMGQRKEHLKKLLVDEEDHCRLWLETGAILELWCWRKLKVKKKDGKFGKAHRWVPRIDMIKLGKKGKLESQEKTDA